MKLSDIKPNPDNPRTATKEDIEKLKNSINQLPKMMRLRPIVVNKDNIIVGGNQRYNALKLLGKTEIPDDWVAKADDFTEEELRRFVVQDNVSSGAWDWDVLANQYELEDLEAWGVELPKLELPTDEEWADAFDNNAPEKLKGLRQFTLILHEKDLALVRGRLKSDKSFGEQLLIELGIDYDSTAYNQS